MRRRLGAVGVSLLIAALLGSGCTEALRRVDAPICDLTVNTKGATIILMAQAVPTAQRIPCIEAYPNGWDMGDLFVRDGKARFSLDHDRAGTDAITVTLQERCEVGGFEQISSDEDGTDRYERIEQVDPFRSQWLYRFPGGCVIYEFAFSEGDESLVRELAVALGFVTRDQAAEAVDDSYPDDVKL